MRGGGAGGAARGGRCGTHGLCRSALRSAAERVRKLQAQHRRCGDRGRARRLAPRRGVGFRHQRPPRPGRLERGAEAEAAFERSAPEAAADRAEARGREARGPCEARVACDARRITAQ